MCDHTPRVSCEVRCVLGQTQTVWKPKRNSGKVIEADSAWSVHTFPLCQVFSQPTPPQQDECTAVR